MHPRGFNIRTSMRPFYSVDYLSVDVSFSQIVSFGGCIHVMRVVVSVDVSVSMSPRGLPFFFFFFQRGFFQSSSRFSLIWENNFLGSLDISFHDKQPQRGQNAARIVVTYRKLLIERYRDGMDIVFLAGSVQEKGGGFLAVCEVS